MSVLRWKTDFFTMFYSIPMSGVSASSPKVRVYTQPGRRDLLFTTIFLFRMGNLRRFPQAFPTSKHSGVCDYSHRLTSVLNKYPSSHHTIFVIRSAISVKVNWKGLHRLEENFKFPFLLHLFHCQNGWIRQGIHETLNYVLWFLIKNRMDWRFPQKIYDLVP